MTDVAAQPLGPKGFSEIERRRLVHEAENAGLIAEAIVTLLLNTGLRVDELVTLIWERVHFQARSGWIDVVGKGDKRRRLPLNAGARKALGAIQPTLSEKPFGHMRHVPALARTTRRACSPRHRCRPPAAESG